MTAWTPLVDVGIDAPGLEFGVPTAKVEDAEIRRFWEEVERHPRFGRTITTDRLDELLGQGARRIAPPLTVGSCFVFDQYVPHRTQILPEAAKPRLALEFRIGPADQGPGAFLGKRAARLLGARYDRAADNLSITALAALFPELATPDAAE